MWCKKMKRKSESTLDIENLTNILNYLEEHIGIVSLEAYRLETCTRALRDELKKVQKDG